MQKQYWNFMVQVKYGIFYLEMHQKKAYRIDNVINILCATVSSASIAAWTIWQKIPFIWAIIIGAFQVVSVIRNFLPYGKIIKIVPQYIGDLNYLENDIEHGWNELASGKMTGAELNDLLYKLKTEYTKIDNKYSNEIMISDNKKYIKKASKMADEYFEKFFCGRN